ncbi:hypothetical protein F5X96DRAFT_665883 [Biscogniauxia mediterranea]|nr:hypothetical protein F5X96DRAFT_665883 [Biscogniauxia mediterranea]
MDYTSHDQEDFSLWGDAEQLLAFDQDPTDGQDEHHEPTTSVYPDPETVQSNAYASYSQAQTPDLQQSSLDQTTLANPARQTFPQAQLTWPTSSSFQAATHIAADNATVYGPVSDGNDAIVDGASGENYNATINEPTTQVYDAIVNESGLENDTEDHAITNHPASEGGNPAIPSTAPTMAAPAAAHDTREMYADEMNQAKAYFRDLNNQPCPICGRSMEQMFRHVASHVKKCELGGCDEYFPSAGAAGRHLLNHEKHNAGGRHCCFGCSVYPQTRAWELSIHLRQHMVAHLVVRGRLGELSP